MCIGFTLNLVPPPPYSGACFKAFPIMFNHRDAEKVIKELVRNEASNKILRVKGTEVTLAVRVLVTPYPEGVCATWVMVAATYIPLKSGVKKL